MNHNPLTGLKAKGFNTSPLSLDRLVPHPHDENFRHRPSAPQPPASTASPKLSPSQDKLSPSRARLAQTSATRGPACLRYIQIPLPIVLVCVAGQPCIRQL